LTGTTLNGTAASLETFRGRPGIIEFWASWCEACQAMSANIASVAKDHPVITVASLSGSAERVGTYLNDNRLSFPVVVDPQGRLAASYGVSAFPTVVIIDKRGKILFTESGYTTELGLRARLWFAQKLNWSGEKSDVR
jgi:thiol-disulfide isomerase/thioredoxin